MHGKSTLLRLYQKINSTNRRFLIMKTPQNPNEQILRRFVVNNNLIGDSSSLFEVFVEPSEELSVPYQRVLWTEYLMRLVLKFYQTSRNTNHAGCCKCLQRLGVRDAEVVLSRDNHNRGIPICYEFVRRVCVRANCSLI